MATRVVTVNNILDGHVGLDLECFDRIYLNVSMSSPLLFERCAGWKPFVLPGSRAGGT